MTPDEKRKVTELKNALNDAVEAAWKRNELECTALMLRALLLKRELGL